MSKLQQEDSVNLRLLNHNDSTLDLGDDSLSHDIVGPSRTTASALSWLSTKRVLLKAFCGITLFAIVVTGLVLSRQPIIAHVSNWHKSASDQTLSRFRDKSLYVASKQGPRFRGVHSPSQSMSSVDVFDVPDNLINGTKYVTASIIGGFSMSIGLLDTCCTLITICTVANQVMVQVNLIYLAVLAGRVPVIGDFAAAHMHGNPGFLPVSEVYDLPRLAETLQMPILEWRDLKNRSSRIMEEIGCWSLQHTLFGADFGSGGHFATEQEFALGECLISSGRVSFLMYDGRHLSHPRPKFSIHSPF